MISTPWTMKVDDWVELSRLRILFLFSESEGNITLRTAYNELQGIDKETRRYKEIREATEKDLEDCRQRGIALEDVSIW